MSRDRTRVHVPCVHVSRAHPHGDAAGQVPAPVLVVLHQLSHINKSKSNTALNATTEETSKTPSGLRTERATARQPPVCLSYQLRVLLPSTDCPCKDGCGHIFICIFADWEDKVRYDGWYLEQSEYNVDRLGQGWRANGLAPECVR